MRRFTSGLVFALAIIALPATAQDTSQVPTIVTIGEASIHRAADQAFVNVSVESRAKVPRDAQKQNAEMMAAVQQKVTEAGISRDAVRTTGYSIQQEFDYANGKRTPRGYVAHNGVEIRVDAIDRTGEILDVVIQAGATSIAGIRFDVKDRSALERDVLGHAVEDARARANALAAGAGRTVDRVIRIDDSRAPRVDPQPQMMLRMAAADTAVQTPIEAGLIEIRAQVTLVVSIK